MDAKKILIVDDSALTRRVICDIINSDSRYQVEAMANNGIDALKLLEERKEGWRVEDLRELEPIVVPLTGAKVIYTHIRGSIDHL